MPVLRSKIFKFVAAALASLAVLVLAWFAANGLRKWQDARAARAHVQDIVARLDLAAIPDVHQRLDQVRGFINDHSERKLDAEFYANRRSAAAFASGVLAHAKGQLSDPINMECSTRTRLMRAILNALGDRTRDVAIFDSHRNLKSHSFLEVLNPETRRWETQDADFDIYWRDQRTGERVSLAERAEALDTIEPCGRDRCGWDQASREGLKPEMLKVFLDIVSITDRESGLRYAVYTSRADLDRTYRKRGNTGAFCEVETKRCEDGFHDIRTYRPGAR
jgi:hypothetical protein